MKDNLIKPEWIRLAKENLSWLMYFVLILVSWYFLRNDVVKMDEFVHMRQITGLSSGNFQHDPFLTTVKGFHWIMAGLHYLTDSIASLRLLNAMFGFASVFIFLGCWRIVSPNSEEARVWQFAFLPILLPYSFLVYTDTLALTIVMLGFYFCLRQKYLLGILILVLSMGVRQNSIIWLLAAPTFAWCFHNPDFYRLTRLLSLEAWKDYALKT